MALGKLLFLLIAASVFAQNPAVDRHHDVVTGEPLWRRALGGVVTALPSVQNQTVVVALDGGNIRAYSSSGTLLWNFFSGGRLSPFITRSREGTSYIFRTNGTLIAVSRSGRELWRTRVGGLLSGHIVTGWDGRLFVPTENRVFCFTPSGNLLWTRSFEEAISISPRLDQSGGIILALENNTVLHLSPFGETHFWRLSARPAALISLSPENGNGAIPEVLVIFENGTMEILNVAEDWFMPAMLGENQRLLPRLPAGPLAAASKGNYVAALLTDGRVMLISIDEMEILWSVPSHVRQGGAGRHETAITFDDWGIYVFSQSGACGFTREGIRLWSTLLPNSASLPALGCDGILFSGDRDWVLSAHKLELRDPDDNPPLLNPAQELSYGLGPRQRTQWARSGVFVDEFVVRNRLHSIGAEIYSGRVGVNEPAWTAWLMEVADFSPVHGVGAAHEIQNRITALHLLGRMGSSEAVPWLARLFRNETNRAVKAAAAAAIGAIGVDRDGLAMRVFLEAATISNLNNAQYLAAIATATGALCRLSGPHVGEYGIRILRMLAMDTLPLPVREQARRELDNLSL